MGSTVPGVLAALATLAASATGSNVIVGEALAGQPADYIAIGYSDQSPGIVNTQTIADYALRSSMEEFDVIGVVYGRDGGEDLTATADRAYALLDLIDAALLANPRLGETCMLAQRTTSELRLSRGDGALAALAFTVHVQAQRS